MRMPIRYRGLHSCRGSRRIRRGRSRGSSFLLPASRRSSVRRPIPPNGKKSSPASTAWLLLDRPYTYGRSSNRRSPGRPIVGNRGTVRAARGDTARAVLPDNARPHGRPVRAGSRTVGNRGRCSKVHCNSRRLRVCSNLPMVGRGQARNCSGCRSRSTRSSASERPRAITAMERIGGADNTYYVNCSLYPKKEPQSGEHRRTGARGKIIEFRGRVYRLCPPPPPERSPPPPPWLTAGADVWFPPPPLGGADARGALPPPAADPRFPLKSARGVSNRPAGVGALRSRTIGGLMRTGSANRCEVLFSNLPGASDPRAPRFGTSLRGSACSERTTGGSTLLPPRDGSPKRRQFPAGAGIDRSAGAACRSAGPAEPREGDSLSCLQPRPESCAARPDSTAGDALPLTDGEGPPDALPNRLHPSADLDDVGRSGAPRGATSLPGSAAALRPGVLLNVRLETSSICCLCCSKGTRATASGCRRE